MAIHISRINIIINTNTALQKMIIVYVIVLLRISMAIQLLVPYHLLIIRMYYLVYHLEHRHRYRDRRLYKISMMHAIATTTTANSWNCNTNTSKSLYTRLNILHHLHHYFNHRHSPRPGRGHVNQHRLPYHGTHYNICHVPYL